MFRNPRLFAPGLAPVTAVADEVTEPIYDSALYAAAGQALLSFFITPFGQGVTAFGGGGTKNLCDTNLEGPGGQLPQNWFMRVQGISLVTWATSATQFADTQLALHAAVFRFTKGTKPWFTVPAKRLTGGCGVSGVAATAVGGSPLTIQAARNGEADPRAIYPLPVPIDIRGGENFKVELLWHAVQAVTATIPITIFLEGRKQRAM